MTAVLAYIAAIYGLLFLHSAVHRIAKRALGGDTSDHLANIVVHSLHITWVSALSLGIVLMEYDARAHNALVVFPTLFLTTFYMHELNVRRMTTDIRLHHAAFVAIFLMALHDKMVILFNCFNVIEFGHLFHFIPYIMYRLGAPLRSVVRAADVSVIGFALVRIVAFLGIALFVAATNWDMLMAYSPLRQLAAFGLVTVLFVLQFWMQRDVIMSRERVLKKMGSAGGARAEGERGREPAAPSSPAARTCPAAASSSGRPAARPSPG